MKFCLRVIGSAYWSDFGDYSECSVTCGSGVRTRSRTCIYPRCWDGVDCDGDEDETIDCGVERSAFLSNKNPLTCCDNLLAIPTCFMYLSIVAQPLTFQGLVNLRRMVRGVNAHSRAARVCANATAAAPSLPASTALAVWDRLGSDRGAAPEVSSATFSYECIGGISKRLSRNLRGYSNERHDFTCDSPIVDVKATDHTSINKVEIGANNLLDIIAVEQH